MRERRAGPGSQLTASTPPGASGTALAPRARTARSVQRCPRPSRCTCRVTASLPPRCWARVPRPAPPRPSHHQLPQGLGDRRLRPAFAAGPTARPSVSSPSMSRCVAAHPAPRAARRPPPIDAVARPHRLQGRQRLLLRIAARRRGQEGPDGPLTLNRQHRPARSPKPPEPTGSTSSKPATLVWRQPNQVSTDAGRKPRAGRVAGQQPARRPRWPLCSGRQDASALSAAIARATRLARSGAPCAMSACRHKVARPCSASRRAVPRRLAHCRPKPCCSSTQARGSASGSCHSVVTGSPGPVRRPKTRRVASGAPGWASAPPAARLSRTMPVRRQGKATDRFCTGACDRRRATSAARPSCSATLRASGRAPFPRPSGPAASRPAPPGR